MTGDNGLRDAVAGVLAEHAAPEWTLPRNLARRDCRCGRVFLSDLERAATTAHATHQAEQVAALPAIREALAAVAQESFDAAAARVLAEEVDRLKADLRAAVAQRDAALLIHVPNGNVLARCAHDARLWPCPTVRALGDASVTVPRCQHLSPSPWGTTQCALPDGHDERHAYNPSEVL